MPFPAKSFSAATANQMATRAATSLLSYGDNLLFLKDTYMYMRLYFSTHYRFVKDVEVASARLQVMILPTYAKNNCTYFILIDY
jgi:hypothetical protein